jgi:hypothetical protein
MRMPKILARRCQIAVGGAVVAMLLAGPVVATSASASPLSDQPITSINVQGGMVPEARGVVPSLNGQDLSPDLSGPSCRSVTFYGSAGAIYVQTSPGGYVTWGIYMYNSALNPGPWLVNVMVNGKQVDHKSQEYAPHASVPPKIAKKGSYFSLYAVHYSVVTEIWYGSVPNGCIVP